MSSQSYFKYIVCASALLACFVIIFLPLGSLTVTGAGKTKMINEKKMKTERLTLYSPGSA